MDATVLGQYKASLHLPHVIWDMKMEKEKQSSVDRVENDFDTRFTIYSTGLA